jgi:hypothetical protein
VATDNFGLLTALRRQPALLVMIEGSAWCHVCDRAYEKDVLLLTFKRRDMRTQEQDTVKQFQICKSCRGRLAEFSK